MTREIEATILVLVKQPGLSGAPSNPAQLRRGVPRARALLLRAPPGAHHGGPQLGYHQMRSRRGRLGPRRSAARARCVALGGHTPRSAWRACRLFRRLRCSPAFAPLTGTDELLLGVSVLPDVVVVQDVPRDEGAFVVHICIPVFQRRMPISGDINIESIARGASVLRTRRLWVLSFLILAFSHDVCVPHQHHPPGIWLVALALLEHSPPTWIDLHLFIQESADSSPAYPSLKYFHSLHVDEDTDCPFCEIEYAACFGKKSSASDSEMLHPECVLRRARAGILQPVFQNKGLSLISNDQPPDSAAIYEDIVARAGINVQRAAAIFALLKESGVAYAEAWTEGEAECVAQRDAAQQSCGAARDPDALPAPLPSLRGVFPQLHLPRVAKRARRRPALLLGLPCPADAAVKKKVHKQDRRAWTSLDSEDFPSTKVKALLGDLVQFSWANRYSANYDPSSIEVQMVNGQGNCVDDCVVKTVVLWLPVDQHAGQVEDALNAAGIRYNRLDGTMKRDERTRTMDALKHDPGCEVLLFDFLHDNTVINDNNSAGGHVLCN
ncbi:hypothetical protein B0H21DRAFT_818671 [Amylocystis lapponica]|nr:hypothetical protein B0H21DRAFT_818671 [Amylocystis lapponica]